MGDDEAGTARAVREHREAATPIVRGFGGRLVKTMGDGVLLEFPSVVAAVECAIRMQQQMAERNAGLPEARRILYRIGVNLGDVLIDGEDILGDGVNIAARLEAICEPGGVCISGSAYDHVRGRIEAEIVDLGEKALKNIARPVRAYALGVADVARANVMTPAAPVPQKRRFGLAPLAAALAALLVVIAAGAWQFLNAHRPARRLEGAGRGRASLDRRAALRQSERRPGAGLPRRRADRRTDHHPRAHPRHFRHCAQHRHDFQGQAGRR